MNETDKIIAAVGAAIIKNQALIIKCIKDLSDGKPVETRAVKELSNLSDHLMEMAEQDDLS